MNEHGSYDLIVEGQTLTFRAYGTWNYETAKRWREETTKLVNGINDKPWACLVDLGHWELATPDIRSYAYDFNLWLNNNDLKYLAVVYRLHIQKEILKISHAALTNVKIKYFDNLEDANEWLSIIGF